MLYTDGGQIECRADGDHTVIAGRFPYGVETELADGRFEVMAPGALQPRADAYLLAGHDFNRPLASRSAGSFTVQSDDEALTFEARIGPEVANTSHGRDALALIRAGLAVGLSPGFRVKPDGVGITQRADGLLRTIRAAELFELSVVTRPAYGAAQVEARSWKPDHVRPAMFFLGYR